MSTEEGLLQVHSGCGGDAFAIFFVQHEGKQPYLELRCSKCGGNVGNMRAPNSALVAADWMRAGIEK